MVKSSQNLTYEGFAYHHSYESNPQEQKFSLHCHKMYELYFFISGGGNFLVQTTLYKLAPGDLLLLRPGEYHRFIPTSPVGYERYCLHFDGALMAEYPRLLQPFNDRKAGTYNLLRPDRELFTDLFSRLDRAALMPPDTRRMLGGFLLGELLTYVAAFAGDRICYIGGEHMPPLVEQLLQFIHEHLTEPLNLDILSEQVFLTKSHISRVFKAAMGIAPMEYITRKRIQLARQYLHEGEGAEDTAARCGFGDYSSFYRAYRRIIGRSPSQAEPTTKGEDAREKHTGSQGRAL